MSQIDLFPTSPVLSTWLEGSPRVGQVVLDPERVRWRVAARLTRGGVVKLKLQSVDIERNPVTLEWAKVRQIYRPEAP